MSDTPTTPSYTCVRNAWRAHEGELRRFLMNRLSDPHLAEDVLQDVFLKAMRQGGKFCSLGSARAWLFEVARNAIADHFRVHRDTIALPEDLPVENELPPLVDGLAACLPRVLSELPEQDREAILLCDLQGMKQEDYARLKGVSLPGAKSRVQRARKRLMVQLKHACQVELDEQGTVVHFVPRPPLA